MTDKELMQQALEALEEGYKTHTPEFKNAINALRERLAQPEQEPDDGYCKACDGWKCTSKVGCVALDNPPQRKPLTDDEIWREYRFLWPFHPAEERKLASDILIFARAIEAAHGIKERKK
jgi:hypothetical protein